MPPDLVLEALKERLNAVEEENETLRDRIEELERVFGMRSILYPVEWGLSPSEQKVMGVLLTREMATKDALMAALYTANGRDEAELKIVDVFICKMRKKLKPFAISITTVWAQGYALPPDIRRTLRAKLLEKPAA